MAWLVFHLYSRFSIRFSISRVSIGYYNWVLVDIKNTNYYFYYTDYEFIRYRYPKNCCNLLQIFFVYQVVHHLLQLHRLFLRRLPVLLQHVSLSEYIMLNRNWNKYLIFFFWRCNVVMEYNRWNSSWNDWMVR